MWPLSVYLSIAAVWIWFPLIPKGIYRVAALGPNRAPGCGEKPATILRQNFNAYFQSEKENLKALAEEIENIDYLQEEGRCPSDTEYLTVAQRDNSFHIQPLIDQLLSKRIEVRQIIEDSVANEAEGFGTFSDETEMLMVDETIRNLHITAEAAKDAVDGFLAEIGNLPRLRYNAPSQDEEEERKSMWESEGKKLDRKLFELAMAIDEAHPDGDYLVEYVVGARQNLQDRFDKLIETMSVTVSSYDNELEMHDKRNDEYLEPWFPKGNTYRDIVGALTRWCLCWEKGVEGAAEALRAIEPVPEAEDPNPVKWGAVGRGLDQIGRSLWANLRGVRDRPRTPPPSGRKNN
ncbi:hypothetical protein TWF506_002081 [Arthrobotrys conoides]|uniref:Uncharacterized protein n=1 Tax=Arthrobotrys conoides TaxID=74498 RepID=A0AAN8NNZ0_9PEZI